MKPSPRAFVWLAAVVVPFLFFSRTALHPATNLVAARPNASPFDDPTTNATAMARAWARWDARDLAAHDDRIFAPEPNAIALGEYYPIPSLVGYPFARLFQSIPLGVNVPYLLALVFFPVVLYALYARLAGEGYVVALLAFVVAYGPGRMNTLGVMGSLTNAFGLLAVLAALRYLDDGRPKDLVITSIALLVQSLSSLYGVAMTCLFAPLAVAIVFIGRGRGLSLRRAAALAAGACLALALGAACQLPYFRLSSEIGVVTSTATFEQHAADLLSLLHGGIFGGPVKEALQIAVPGFPIGAAAFFPTLTFVFVLTLYAIRRSRPIDGPSPALWVLLAVAFFVAALGPTIRFAGRPLF
ncbi:MAG TPA: hypothetical protein VGR00_08915, partial [Thermoanaerobaculia bacterium]|nr:hypothetical protein [Thermoanaerobaculia bacterium]